VQTAVCKQKKLLTPIAASPDRLYPTSVFAVCGEVRPSALLSADTTGCVPLRLTTAHWERAKRPRLRLGPRRALHAACTMQHLSDTQRTHAHADMAASWHTRTPQPLLIQTAPLTPKAASCLSCHCTRRGQHMPCGRAHTSHSHARDRSRAAFYDSSTTVSS